MTYQTLSVPAFAKLVIKKSEFLAFAYPLTKRDDLGVYRDKLAAIYPDARHICYGYIIGDPSNTTSAGFFDDGEPNGTAGRPILSVLQHKNIGDCAVFVVRYFGGIKLGAGGLTRAYAGAAQLVINEMILSPYVAKTVLCFDSDFANEAFVRHAIAQRGGAVLDCVYGDGVQITASVECVAITSLLQSLGHLVVVKEQS